MADSKKIKLISEDTFSDQRSLDVDNSDASWIVRADSTSSSTESDELAKDWISACQRLRQFPDSYEPHPPFWNTSNFDFNVSGCEMDEVWTACMDLSDAGGGSCYRTDGLMRLAHIMPSRYAHPIYGVIFPVLVFFAVVANVFVLLVLSKRHMQSPTNIVLLYMALADLTVGIVPLPFTFYWFTLKNYATPWRLTPSGCYMYHYLMDALPPICHNVAIWLTVLLAAQRYVYIEFPVRAQAMCTIQNVKRASLVIVALSVLLGAMKFGDSSYKTYRGLAIGLDHEGRVHTEYVVGACLCHWSRLVRAISYEHYYETYFWIRAVVSVWLPSTLLICLNALLIRAIHNAQRRRDRLLSESRNREATRQKESNTTTTMLVIIVSIFLLVNCPQGLHIAVMTINLKMNLNLAFLQDESDARGLFLMIDNMLIIATYPLNFAIYCSMSTQFRETFKHLFCSSLLSDSAVARRTSSYYGYTQVASRTTSYVRNGSMPDSSTSLVQSSNSKCRKDVSRAKSGRTSGQQRPSDGSVDKENVSDTCV